MKKSHLLHIASFLLLLMLAFLPSTSYAQKAKKSTKQSGPGYIVKTIPSKMNLKDKIIVENESSYLLTEVRVYLVDRKGKYQRLGIAKNLATDKKSEIISYNDNKLENLLGRKIAISIKGVKNKTTYSFDVNLDDHHHDLYIEIVDKGKR